MIARDRLQLVSGCPRAPRTARAASHSASPAPGVAEEADDERRPMCPWIRHSGEASRQRRRPTWDTHHVRTPRKRHGPRIAAAGRRAVSVSRPACCGSSPSNRPACRWWGGTGTRRPCRSSSTGRRTSREDRCCGAVAAAVPRSRRRGTATAAVPGGIAAAPRTAAAPYPPPVARAPPCGWPGTRGTGGAQNPFSA